MTQSSITTFNNAISLPQKNGKAYPLFDYEQMLFDTLQTKAHLDKEGDWSRYNRVYLALYRMAVLQ